MKGCDLLARVQRWIDWVRSYASDHRMDDAERLAQAILAIKPEEIDQWASERAEMPLRDVDGDWDSFSYRFCLPSREDVPDMGGVICTLHVLVDRAAGITGISYAY